MEKGVEIPHILINFALHLAREISILWDCLAKESFSRLETRKAYPRGMEKGVEIPHILINFALHLAGELSTLNLYNTKVSNCHLKVIAIV